MRRPSPRVLFVSVVGLLVAGLIGVVAVDGDGEPAAQTVVAGGDGRSSPGRGWGEWPTRRLPPTSVATTAAPTAEAPPSTSAASSAVRAPSPRRAASAPGPAATGTLQGSGLYVVAPDASGLRRLTSGVVHFPAWSPDGSRIAFVRDSRLYVIGPDGTHLQALATPGPVNHPPSWSPDGSRLAYVSNDRLYVTSPGGASTEITAGSGLRAVSWSPDGARFAVLEMNHLDVVDVDGSDRRRVFSRAGWDTGPAWAPDSTRVALLDWDLGPAVVHVDTGAIVPLTTPRNMAWRASWSPSGAEVAYSHSTQSSSDLAAGRADGSGIRIVTSGAVNPAWSPDGARIAFMTNRNPGGTGRLVTELYVIGADGSGERRLTSNGRVGAADEPVWSPDSRTIAFAYNSG